MADITFGTDGWRAVIAEDFTFANVRLVAQAISDYLLDPKRENLEIYHIKKKGSYSCQFRPASAGISIGYDTRFLSGDFALESAKVLSANGIPVFLSEEPSSTPSVSFSVKSGQRAGAVVITASHNPPRYNGIKFKPEYASSGLPDVMSLIEKKVQYLLEGTGEIKTGLSAPIVKFSPKLEYLSQLAKLVDLKLIASKNFSIIADPMYGTTIGYLKSLIEGAGGKITEIRNQINPSFGGVNPEPIDKNLSPLIEAAKENKCDAGFAFDGDGDRIGAVDSNGRFLNSHYIFSLMLWHLVENKKWSGGVVKTFSTTQMVNILCEKYGLKLYETPIGFKYICQLMLE
ncbi:MAG: phosphoglucomutase/phosphomannomutase family protein, partial [Firmicutes bacterium]|nr:phosphoglucomutase/phosphomannomutase family protein [Bacillota bacterium]